MTIASALDKLNDKLAGSDQPGAQTIEGMILRIIDNIDQGGGGSIPVASADTLGGIKVGENLSITDGGVLSASGGGGGAGIFWVTITPNQAETGLIFDKTFGEVLTALNSGSYVVCKFDDGTILYMPLLWTMDGIPVDDYGYVAVFDSNSDTFQSTYTANSYESYPEYIYE